jgi:hypothetical protein
MQTRVIHLTAQGIERFAAELNELVSLRRPAVTARLRRAREQSDSDATWSPLVDKILTGCSRALTAG